MGKHRIKMSLCVCFREMAEREGGKKLALRHVLSPSGKVQFTHALQMSEFNSTNTGQTAQ